MTTLRSIVDLLRCAPDTLGMTTAQRARVGHAIAELELIGVEEDRSFGSPLGAAATSTPPDEPRPLAACPICAGAWWKLGQALHIAAAEFANCGYRPGG